MADVYVEFPVDNIVGVHWTDDGPPPEPEEPHVCGEYILDEHSGPIGPGAVPAGPPDYTAGFAAWLTTGGIFFSPTWGVLDDRDVVMTNAVRFAVEWRLTSESFPYDSLNPNPGGTVVNGFIGSGIGLGVGHPVKDNLDPHLSHYPAPHPPNLDTGAVSDITTIGTTMFSTSATYSLEDNPNDKGKVALWLQATGVYTGFHNIVTEPAPSNGWLILNFRGTNNYLRITGYCRD